MSLGPLTPGDGCKQVFGRVADSSVSSFSDLLSGMSNPSSSSPLYSSDSFSQSSSSPESPETHRQGRKRRRLADSASRRQPENDEMSLEQVGWGAQK